MSNRLLTPDDLPAKGIKLSNSQRWRLEQAGKFPRRVHPSPGRIGYVEREIDEHIDKCIAARDAVSEVA